MLSFLEVSLLFGGLSGQVAGADGDKTVVELVEHLQPSSPASFLGRWAVEGIKHD